MIDMTAYIISNQPNKYTQCIVDFNILGILDLCWLQALIYFFIYRLTYLSNVLQQSEDITERCENALRIQLYHCGITTKK